MPLLARSPSTNRKYPPLPVDKLEEEINRRMADDNKLFREEFNVSAFASPSLPQLEGWMGAGHLNKGVSSLHGSVFFQWTQPSQYGVVVIFQTGPKGFSVPLQSDGCLLQGGQ